MKRTQQLILQALFAALLAVGAWVTVPSAIPFTLQSFALYLSLLVLGGRRGSITVALYLLLGFMGVPVFSGFRGGASVLFGVTGGYLWGFLLTALLYWAAETGGACKRKQIAALVVGQLLGYLFGSVWFSLLCGDRFGVALLTCVLPFLLPDGVKLCAAVWVSDRLHRVVKF